MSFRIIVCGGRDYSDEKHVFTVLDRMFVQHGVSSVVTGACRDSQGNPRGADGLAEKWARRREIAYHGFPARFTESGPSAGPKRNRRMFELAAADLVVAFPGGKGTADMCRVAEAAECPVVDERQYKKENPASEAGLDRPIDESRGAG